MNCKTCLYFKKQIDPNNVKFDGGHCMFNPPIPHLVPTQIAPGQNGLIPVSARPTVESEDYCSNHEVEGESEVIDF